MTSPLGDVAASAAPYSAPTTSVNRSDQMGKDTFMKLLVAQLRYQDPSNPVSTSESLAQFASFTQVEKLDELVKQNTTAALAQKTLSAGALVGHAASYTDNTGATVTGLVTSVRFRADEPTAVIGDVEVPVGRLTAVALPTA